MWAVNDKPTYCCLCAAEAVAIYYLPQGCAVLADQTVQPRCAQHEARMRGGTQPFELIKDLRRAASPAAIDTASAR
jgi:hypothetical protein